MPSHLYEISCFCFLVSTRNETHNLLFLYLRMKNCVKAIKIICVAPFRCDDSSTSFDNIQNKRIEMSRELYMIFTPGNFIMLNICFTHMKLLRSFSLERDLIFDWNRDWKLFIRFGIFFLKQTTIVKNKNKFASHKWSMQHEWLLCIRK